MLEVDKPADTHSTNEKLEFMMSVEQKEWLMAVMSGDEKKMMNMLNTNPDLVNWQNYIDGVSPDDAVVLDGLSISNLKLIRRDLHLPLTTTYCYLTSECFVTTMSTCLSYIDLFCTYILQNFCQSCRISSKLLYFAISDGSLQNSALHFAAKFGNCALIRMLVGNHHADVNIRNNAVSRLTDRCCPRIGH
ncbi:hypothetical protein EG68_08068 [Paragonimus skrjabini miyazakii]|uniref:ANK_REP_REGION domain-containing protein n=1 Tax=Paragonimus skrjabini miyazakii TaxID=59628 RepID=A0A8S9YCN3_9TREM|nr:hypothetical protein EG68_08068 [Paragonimus skrjabini miyazakii]